MYNPAGRLENSMSTGQIEGPRGRWEKWKERWRAFKNNYVGMPAVVGIAAASVVAGVMLMALWDTAYQPRLTSTRTEATTAPSSSGMSEADTQRKIDDAVHSAVADARAKQKDQDEGEMLGLPRDFSKLPPGDYVTLIATNINGHQMVAVKLAPNGKDSAQDYFVKEAPQEDLERCHQFKVGTQSEQ